MLVSCNIIYLNMVESRIDHLKYHENLWSEVGILNDSTNAWIPPTCKSDGSPPSGGPSASKHRTGSPSHMDLTSSFRFDFAGRVVETLSEDRN